MSNKMMLRCITMIIMLKELTSWYLVKLYGFTSLYDLWLSRVVITSWHVSHPLLDLSKFSLMF